MAEAEAARELADAATVPTPEPVAIGEPGAGCPLPWSVRDTPAGVLRERFSDYDGAQPNDPVKAAQAILRAVDDDTSPLRLPLGPEAVTLIRRKLQRQLADLDSWETVSFDTRYPGA
ncbi:hypothetical protein OG417_12510 [Actinoallomurus sp. NBC_01490]|jgi:hypothetical protein|uniref:hypothetical protein n=1 Tax=Actinoallomurus sp. NBC_01490 TaxID=2903557 RepID=UPI002E324BC7|nr:hypothetical protein [Actinoallomurus sp. NBC_01490]